jgi:hypothetical protein
MQFRNTYGNSVALLFGKGFELTIFVSEPDAMTRETPQTGPLANTLLILDTNTHTCLFLTTPSKVGWAQCFLWFPSIRREKSIDKMKTPFSRFIGKNDKKTLLLFAAIRGLDLIRKVFFLRFEGSNKRMLGDTQRKKTLLEFFVKKSCFCFVFAKFEQPGTAYVHRYLQYLIMHHYIGTVSEHATD